MTFEELQQELNEQTRRHAREIELHQKTRARAERVEARVKELENEIAEGDAWMERAKRFQENGGCPCCFASDSEGHRPGCAWLEDIVRGEELEAVAQADHHIREDERAGIMRIANERAERAEKRVKELESDLERAREK
jgi:hypothetical protein